MLLFRSDAPHAAAEGAVSLVLAVTACLFVSQDTRYAALAILVDRAVPVLAASELIYLADKELPSLAAIALACVLIACKQHECLSPLLSELVSAAVGVGVSVRGFVGLFQLHILAAPEITYVRPLVYARRKWLTPSYGCASMSTSAHAPCFSTIFRRCCRKLKTAAYRRCIMCGS